MRILFIAPSAYLLGGVQDWLYMIVMGLREKGHSVVVGAPNSETHNIQRFNTYFRGIEAKSFVNRTGTEEGRVSALSKFLANHPVDIIVGVNIGDLYESFYRVRENLINTKIVMTLHAIEMNYFEDIKEYSSLLDAVITTNRLTKKMVERMSCMPKDRIYYAPYGIETRRDEHLALEHEILRIAWVGRIEQKQKRVMDIADILVNLDKNDISYKLSIAGDGPLLEELKESLESWIKRGKVIFVGCLRKNDMPFFYSQHNVLLITSQWETGPIVAWEAMASGLVVVSSEFIGSKCEEALVHDSTALIYPVGDTEAAALEIKRLSDIGLRELIAKRSSKLVCERYSRVASLDAWEKALISIMNKEIRKELLTSKIRRRKASGRLESLLGAELSERIRFFLPRRKRLHSSPGSEWPHSLQAKDDQSFILDYAKETDTLS